MHPKQEEPLIATTTISGGIIPKRSNRGLMYYTRDVLARLGMTILGLLALAIFLLPLAYVLSTSLKLDSQMTTVGAPVWPAAPTMYKYQGQDYPLFDVPVEGGGTQRLAMIKPYREDSDMVDPAHPEKGIFNVKGRWRTWQAVYKFSPQIKNFTDAWDQVNFPRLFINSLLLSTISTIGTLLSCILVAYGF